MSGSIQSPNQEDNNYQKSSYFLIYLFFFSAHKVIIKFSIFKIFLCIHYFLSLNQNNEAVYASSF